MLSVPARWETMATTLCLQGRKPRVKNGTPSLMFLLWHKDKFLSSLRYWYLGSVSYSSSDFTLTHWTFHTTSTGPCPQWEQKSFVKLRQCPCNWLKDSLPPWFTGRPMRRFSWKPYLSAWPAKVTSMRQATSVSDWKQSLSPISAPLFCAAIELDSQGQSGVCIHSLYPPIMIMGLCMPARIQTEFGALYPYHSLVAQLVKNPPAM